MRARLFLHAYGVFDYMLNKKIFSPLVDTQPYDPDQLETLKTRALKNLGTFSTTHMVPEVESYFMQFLLLNGVDQCAYPELEYQITQCEAFFLQLFHAPSHTPHHCFPTSGSSEAIFLSLLMMKKAHQKKKSSPQNSPNLILSPFAHMAFKAAAQALDIEIRQWHADRDNLVLEQSIPTLIDQNTIGFVCSLGNPTTLAFDDIARYNTLLASHYAKTGQFIPIHVDAASGGFIAPFYYPYLTWDFRLTHVQAINVSSHKFGLVYPSLGWLCVSQALCNETSYHEHDYLGKKMNRVPLHFSHSASHIAAQYQNLQILGKAGYQEITLSLYEHLSYLKDKMQLLNYFSFPFSHSECALPGLIFTIPNEKNKPLEHLARFLNERSWHLPTFPHPLKNQERSVARIIVRQGMTYSVINHLLNDLESFILTNL